MMPQKENTTNTESDQDGIDSIIARVDSYMKNPETVTPETLQELKDELVDLKSYLDGGEEQPEEKDDNGSPGLMVMIGKAKRGMQ